MEFICPISRLVMFDPVIVGCGLSYERRCIEKWVLEGNRKWPGSDQELGAVTLIPNNLLKKMILKWCENSFFKDKVLCQEEEEDDAAEKFYGLNPIIQEDEEEEAPPQELLCPICKNLLENPIILAASGHTFDELCIAKWMEECNTNCPKTHQPLSHALLIPNLSIKAIIHKWHSRLAAQGDDGGGGDDKPPLKQQQQQTETISSTLYLFTTRLPSFRALFAQVNGTASKLLNPLLIKMYKSDVVLYNEAVATLMNISVEKSNRTKIVQDCPSLIPFLVEALRFPDSMDTRGYAAAAIAQMSCDDSNSLLIGGSEVFQLLTDLLEVGHPTSREAASAIWSFYIIYVIQSTSDSFLRKLVDEFESILFP
ncbi:hypothetical protein OROHE_012585 [Orobanche hederae]